MAVCKDHCLSCCPNLDCAHEQARVSLIQPPMRPSHARQAVTSSGVLARPCSRAAQPRLQGTLRGRGTAGAVAAEDSRSVPLTVGRRGSPPAADGPHAPLLFHSHTQPRMTADRECNLDSHDRARQAIFPRLSVARAGCCTGALCWLVYNTYLGRL